MTASKPGWHTNNAKAVPKRAVSFSPNVKPEAPLRASEKPKVNTDGDLQALNKRRRYMRRGSKSPAMLQASFVSMMPHLQHYPVLDPTSTSRDVIMQVADKRLIDRAQRRMSLMSALKLTLENTTIADNAAVPKKAERRLSTYQLLSQV
mmetsp:Transcript_215/g.388  ORF Transcript_215/g.388 Transcript_215/m.388 type:complete len:149 (+) Transcript_215:91-537(+)|eukprot:scaffold34915_cov180-Amphora_coffeaeformis.AAC.23